MPPPKSLTVTLLCWEQEKLCVADNVSDEQWAHAGFPKQNPTLTLWLIRRQHNICSVHKVDNCIYKHCNRTVTTVLWVREPASPVWTAEHPQEQLEPLMAEGKRVCWAALTSLTVAGAQQPSRLSSADVSRALLPCAVALSVASIKLGPLDVHSNAASVQRCISVLFFW